MELQTILTKVLEVSPFAGLLLFLLWKAEKRLDEKESKYETRLDAKDESVKQVTDKYHSSQSEHTTVLRELTAVIKERQKK